MMKMQRYCIVFCIIISCTFRAGTYVFLATYIIHQEWDKDHIGYFFHVLFQFIIGEALPMLSFYFMIRFAVKQDENHKSFAD